jgi:pre-mRNA-processing factor SLU7
MAAPSATVSEILKSKSQFDDEPKKKSREEWRKAKELEEARKVSHKISRFDCV